MPTDGASILIGALFRILRPSRRPGRGARCVDAKVSVIEIELLSAYVAWIVSTWAKRLVMG